MRSLLIALQQVNIEEKLKTAPDGNYQVGVLIGSFVPFIVLVGLAYFLYYRAKKKEKNLNN
ncbi:hypothetical protein [Flavobacterium celericrescens]|uniref:Uncharacterized protein n=1 Tax=Flavobacterium celericrescens TaxID=2709780 RepID=A0ABX0ICI3_9FLAO|nr:hypothetical protein [Flavobacterium celericrescens]NHM04898.1 hypothetical protein [Flavobacterium celericrescens]